MPSFINTDQLDAFLSSKVSEDELILPQDVEALCVPMFEDIGLDAETRVKLDVYNKRPTGCTIDAEEALKDLGVIALVGKSNKTKRVLMRPGLIPRDTTGDDDSANETNEDDESEQADLSGEASTDVVLFQTRECKVIARDEVKNGRTYHTIKYMITKIGLHEVLMHAHNDRRFAKYFSTVMQLWSIYKQYTSDHRAEQEKKRAEQAIKVHESFKDDLIIATMKKMDNNMEQMSEQMQRDREQMRRDRELDRERTSDQIDMMGTKLDLANSKLDVTNSQLKLEQLTNKQILDRVGKMSREFYKLKGYATKKSIASTMDPQDTTLRHGFSITTKSGHERGTGKAVCHFETIGGQKAYVEKTIASKVDRDQREVHRGFTPHEGSRFGRNQTRIAEKYAEDEKRQLRIVQLKKEGLDANENFELHLKAWNDPKSARSQINKRIIAANNEMKARITQETKAHNARHSALPPNQRTTRRAKEEFEAAKVPRLTRDDQVLAHLGITREPVHSDFISAERLAEIAEETATLTMMINTPPCVFVAQDIPIKANRIACVWKENEWFSLEMLHDIFDSVLEEMQSMNAKVDDSLFDDSDGDDDLMSEFQGVVSP